MAPTDIVFVLAGLAGINLVSFAQFGWDKRAARKGAWRISEGTLLGVAILGGSVGAKLGQRAFRHKTRKEPFRTSLNLVLIVHGAAVILVSVPQSRRMLVELLGAG